MLIPHGIEFHWKQRRTAVLHITLTDPVRLGQESTQLRVWSLPAGQLFFVHHEKNDWLAAPNNLVLLEKTISTRHQVGPLS